MEIKRVAPETTDVIKYVEEGRGKQGQGAPERIRRVGSGRSKSSDLVFGTIPKSTAGLISLVILFVIALIFGIKVLDISIPIYLIILIFCTIMGALLAGTPGFVSIVLSALLLLVGGVTAMSVSFLFPAVAIGAAMLVSASLIIRGE